MSNLAEKGAANDGKAATTPLSPSLLDLKTKLERSFVSELDTDGDGIITSSEILSAYDTDHSGSLENDELARLAKQLSAQTSDNNKLLMELQRLEQQQLKNQRDAQTKQDALRKALDALEVTRSEALKSKKELQMMISKEDTMSRELLTYKQDLERAKRNLDLAVKEKNLAVRQAENIEQERASITHQFHDTLNEKKQMIEQLEQAKRENSRLQRGLKDDVGTMQDQLMQMKKKMDRMHDRDQANVRTLDSTQKQLVEKTKKVKELEANVRDARRRCLELEDIVKESNVVQKNLRNSFNGVNVSMRRCLYSPKKVNFTTNNNILYLVTLALCV